MKKVRVAVIGYGHLGKWHCQKVEAHSEVAEFIGIVEKNPDGQSAAQTNHPNVKVVSSIDEILNQIDAAFVVTPTSTHFDLVKQLLENGKHVFCEKPLCSNDEEAHKLRLLAAGKNVVIQVGHSERFHEAWEELKNKFYNLPTPFIVRINRSAPFKGRATDVDVIQDLAIHDLDLLLYLFKQKPIEIRATGLKIRTKKWDHANIHVRLENGSEAFIVVGRNSVKEVRDLEVISSNGMVSVDLFLNKIFEATGNVFPDGTFVKENSYQKRDHLLLEHGHFYRSILESKSAIINLEDGLNAVHLIDCTLKSMDSLSAVKVNFE